MGETIELQQLVEIIADTLVFHDGLRKPHKQFLPGIGPYGEPQLVRIVSDALNLLPGLQGSVQTKRTPDLLIASQWALEFKIARPFGDNGREAEDWSVNLLHPYPGNQSVLGDCLKLEKLTLSERKAVIVVGYEHTPPQIDLGVLVKSFEAIAQTVIGIVISGRCQTTRQGLVHPVHQQLHVYGWEVIPRMSTPSDD
jgi:hypothetical protein